MSKYLFLWAVLLIQAITTIHLSIELKETRKWVTALQIREVQRIQEESIK